eukprot:3793301-Rhodomonas_salina.2
MQETACSVQVVPGMRFLAFEFAGYRPTRLLRDVRYLHRTRCCIPTHLLRDVRYLHSVCCNRFATRVRFSRRIGNGGRRGSTPSKRLACKPPKTRE